MDATVKDRGFDGRIFGPAEVSHWPALVDGPNLSIWLSWSKTSLPGVKRH
jgi:hypothetical protein